ncbi:MAG: hypothetical protein JXJ20_02810 [Anaerolineae bacterium]|jgi:hypothetical protein|nr:hypothetical protein [Anaerolineae bacterium]
MGIVGKEVGRFMQEQLYPDILGVLSDERLTVDDVLQCALGIFPAATAIGKPVEMLLLVQNLIDQPLPLRLAILTPTRDAQGNLLNIFTPKPRLEMALAGGDCGLLHLPITPQLPTPTGKNYPVRVRIEVEKPERFVRVRPADSGHRPSLLSISPFRIAALREIHFRAQVHNERQLGVLFDVLPGRFPPLKNEPMPRYEALWTVREDLQKERARAKEKAGEALNFVNRLTRKQVYPLLINRVKDAYGDGGLPLHPGEAIFLAKILTYVMQEGLDMEAGFSLAASQWFQHLCWLMAHDPNVVQNLEQLIKLVFTSVLHDAVLLGFSMVHHNAGIDFGDEHEQADHARKLTAALEGRMPVLMEYVYVPLVLAGVILNARMTMPDENPWRSLDAIQEARDGRISLAGIKFREVFDILDSLIADGERLLREMRIPRD